VQCWGELALPLFQPEIPSSREHMHRFANPLPTCLPLHRMNREHEVTAAAEVVLL
jgi:hypothetical protein